MIHGNARVSMDVQDLTSQLEELTVAGCDKVSRRKISGASPMGS